MKRVFGKKKASVPAPSLSEAGGRVDERVAKCDEKVFFSFSFVTHRGEADQVQLSLFP